MASCITFCLLCSATHVLIHWTDVTAAGLALPFSSQEPANAEQGIIGLILGAGPILWNEHTAFALQMQDIHAAQMTI